MSRIHWILLHNTGRNKRFTAVGWSHVTINEKRGGNGDLLILIVFAPFGRIDYMLRCCGSNVKGQTILSNVCTINTLAGEEIITTI